MGHIVFLLLCHDNHREHFTPATTSVTSTTASRGQQAPPFTMPAAGTTAKNGVAPRSWLLPVLGAIMAAALAAIIASNRGVEKPTVPQPATQIGVHVPTVHVPTGMHTPAQNHGSVGIADPQPISDADVDGVVTQDPSACACDGDSPVGARTGEFAGFQTAPVEDSDFAQRNVSECCCSVLDLERTNSEVVYPLLQQVVASPFFSHYQVDLCMSFPHGLFMYTKGCTLQGVGADEVWTHVQQLPP